MCEQNRLVFSILMVMMYLLCPLYSYTQALIYSGDGLFTTPKMYFAPKCYNEIAVDGIASEADWQRAKWSTLFVDIEGDKKPSPTYDTRMKMLWDDTYLYVYAELEEPHLWATLDDYDDIVYFDNDFELFISPSSSTHNYFELEINALGTIFDLFMPKPYRNQGQPLIAWNIAGLQSSVKLYGSLNDPSDIDSSWSVEFAVPFRAIQMGVYKGGPQHGDIWRVNFSRVQWDLESTADGYIKKIDPQTGHHLPEHNWVWSPQGVINMHYPERWGYLIFDTMETNIASNINYTTSKVLWQLYYLQQLHKKQFGAYATSLENLDQPEEVMKELDLHNPNNQVNIQASDKQFIITMTDTLNQSTWTIDHFGELLMSRDQN